MNIPEERVWDSSTVMTKRIVSKDRGLEMAPILVESMVQEVPTQEAMIMGEPVAIQVVVAAMTIAMAIPQEQTVSGLLTLFFLVLWLSTLLTGFKWTLGQFDDIASFCLQCKCFHF